MVLFCHENKIPMMRRSTISSALSQDKKKGLEQVLRYMFHGTSSPQKSIFFLGLDQLTNPTD